MMPPRPAEFESFGTVKSRMEPASRYRRRHCDSDAGSTVTVTVSMPCSACQPECNRDTRAWPGARPGGCQGSRVRQWLGWVLLCHDC
jgi:hypothetical protein